uniref:uncharacterized protein LOC130473255 n=1 Tax=Euleptes europaea TaxID=460621 RepID=UPI00253FA84E|nr:uncharacterized protein LOC130473255 [Euleptes europaea]
MVAPTANGQYATALPSSPAPFAPSANDQRGPARQFPRAPALSHDGARWVLAPSARRAVRATAHGGPGESCAPGGMMLGAGALAATLLVLVPVTAFPILGRVLVLGERWPGEEKLRPAGNGVMEKHVVEYQQISVADMKNSPSVVERTKRSTKGENVEISVAYLKHLTSALVASATIFGLVLSILSLAACYLYYKRRELKPLLDVVLKGGESPHRSKPNDPNCCSPISLSQSFHFGQSQESSKNQTAMAKSSKTSPEEPTRSYSDESPCKIKKSIMLILWKT